MAAGMSRFPTVGFAVVLFGALAMGTVRDALAQGSSQKASSPIRADWNLRDHIALVDVTVQSHRGAGVLAPENTMAAFEIAWKLGTVPEADIRQTRDGVIVAFHDAAFERLVKDASSQLKKKTVADLTWAELQQLDVGEWKGKEFAGQHAPKMSDVFAAMANHPKRRMYLDIKDVDLAKLPQEVNAARVEDRVIVASTNYAFIRQWKSLCPASGTLLWMGGDENVLNGRLAELRKTNFADITQLQIHVNVKKTAGGDEISPSEAFLKHTGDELRRHNIVFQTLPWGRSDVAIYCRLMDLGVASFATDHPDKTMEAIRQYYAKKREE